MTNRDERWVTANQRYLMARLAVIRTALLRLAGEKPDDDADERDRQAVDDANGRLPATAALDHLCAAFGLSAFERDVALLCAGMELDGHWPLLCAAAQGGETRAYPTFGLALALFGTAHWSALSPAAPLRRSRILDLSPVDAVTSARIALDERVLHFLTGVSYLDERVAALVSPLSAGDPLPPSHASVADALARDLARRASPGARFAVHLVPAQGVSWAAVVATAAQDARMQAVGLPVSHLPRTSAECTAFARLWEREARLAPMVLCVDAGDEALPPHAAEFLGTLDAPFVVVSRHPVRIGGEPPAHVALAQVPFAERRALWARALGRLAPRLDGELDAVTTHFLVPPETMRAIGTRLAAVAPRRRTRKSAGGNDPDAPLRTAFWTACRTEARTDMDALAQRIDPRATWDDIVLPEAEMHTLREIAAQVRHRATVYDAWGFASQSDRGLGISALFSGPSGTGKTMAAEVLASALGLDLFRIDLSQVVSKYIGETEKNLRRVFDAAETGGAILLFDEADALFGRRSEVKDSHDRYANIEVSYLLQRMESYRGLAILTTNSRAALDPAFLRRIRFAIAFPFPDLAHRAEIWQRAFPPAVPTDALDSAKLARLNVPGGNIRNIALGAAFLAADAGEPVRMHHLLRAARTEAVKLRRPVTDAEVAGWT
ncbi:MAG: AAA family ATPase [Betaproteobacteria bacterium]|nr:AAA family ATPase [Betaproteobacteria bacterium]